MNSDNVIVVASFLGIKPLRGFKGASSGAAAARVFPQKVLSTAAA